MRRILWVPALAAVLAALAVAVSATGAGGPHGATAEPNAKTFLAMTQIREVVLGLTPGDSYECTVQFTPTGGGPETTRESGQTQRVQKDGSIDCLFSLAFIDTTLGTPQTGTIRAFINETEDGYDGPIDCSSCPNGVAETDLTVP